MSWLIAVVLRPFFSLLLFGSAAFLAIVVLKPLIPDGRVKTVLYDRTLRTRHPWKFAFLAMATCWGMLGLVGWLVYR